MSMTPRWSSRYRSTVRVNFAKKPTLVLSTARRGRAESGSCSEDHAREYTVTWIGVCGCTSMYNTVVMRQKMARTCGNVITSPIMHTSTSQVQFVQSVLTAQMSYT